MHFLSVSSSPSFFIQCIEGCKSVLGKPFEISRLMIASHWNTGKQQINSEVKSTMVNWDYSEKAVNAI